MMDIQGARHWYLKLLDELAANRVKYQQRERELAARYTGTVLAQHRRTDVILADLSGSAKTISTIMTALSGVVTAELMWVREVHGDSMGV